MSHKILPKILVIDDKRENLVAMKSLLSPLDAEVLTALSGNEGLSLLVHHQIALVLLDVRMPIMDGFEMAELMQEDEDLKEIPIIFVTAISKEQQHVFKGYATGAIDYLFKPIDRHILISKVKAFLMLYEQKRLLSEKNDELRSLRNLLSSIVNFMPSLLIAVSPAGLVTEWNHQAEKETGIQAKDALGKELMDVFPKMQGERAQVEAAIQNNTPYKSSTIRSKQAGQDHFSDLMVYPLSSNGAEGVVIRIDDVTQRAQLEQMMVHTEKMISLGGLAAGMAHEINNPLSGILQSIQNVQRRTSQKNKKNQQVADDCGIKLEQVQAYLQQQRIFQYIQIIKDCSLRAASIVKNMLQFSRDSGGEKISIEITDLIDQVIELASSDYNLGAHSDFKHLKIVRQYPSYSTRISCVITEVEQVFLNLLKNAAEALYKSPQRDQPAQIVVRICLEGDWMRIEVEDNGPGMEPEISKRIFDPFFTTKGGEGTGLGLAISYFIIRQHHQGEFWVESNLGRGTKFIVLLPRQ